jgi:hypothetical protein
MLSTGSCPRARGHQGSLQCPNSFFTLAAKAIPPAPAGQIGGQFTMIDLDTSSI